MFVFLGALVAGFLTKLTDSLHHPLSYLTALGYGMLLGYLVTHDALVALVFLPAVLANALAGKIDSLSHVLGVAAFGVVALYFGVPVFPLVFGFLCLLAALADEKIHVDFLYPRPFLPAAALLTSFASGSFTPVLAVVSFDFGYLGGQVALEKGRKSGRVSMQGGKATSPEKARENPNA
ncbi:hypothetical protein HY572_01920 [Candidatus Micrarchaeota archaeon]|nr:hypothetical protein [Candidatus Micrarchaeota archaeon]